MIERRSRNHWRVVLVILRRLVILSAAKDLVRSEARQMRRFAQHDSGRHVVSLLLMLGSLLAASAPAAEFRVENEVFAGPAKEPVSRSTTIFHGGIVYDYLAEPAEITVFDPARGRFVLLDVTRRVKTEVSTETIGKAIGRLKTRAASSNDPRMQFHANPAFKRQIDDATGEMLFASPWLSYRVRGVKAESAEITSQYREFSDWCAKLNAFLRPGSQPPFARLVVDEALAQREEIPTQVELTLVHKQGLVPQREQLRSQHRLGRKLLEADRRQVAQTDEYLMIFSPIGLTEYQAKPATARR